MLSPAKRAAIAAIGVFLACSAVLRADDVLREGFEGDGTSWRREETDATVKIEAQERSTRAAHEGRSSERFAFTAGAGSVLYYSLDLPRNVPVSKDLRATLFVKTSRPGAQIFGRVVLPDDLDPDTGRPSFVLIPGEVAEEADRWVKLDLEDLPANLAKQARVLRVGTNRKISLEGAYLERLVVNLYGGAGETEVFLDDLTIRPIPPEEEQPKPAADDLEAMPALPEEGRPAPEVAGRSGARGVEIRSNQIYRDGRDWVPTIIDAPGADPFVLAQHGFDVWASDIDVPDRVAESAIKARMLLAPRVKIEADTTPEAALGAMERYRFAKDVAFWDLGDRLGAPRSLKERKDQLERIRKIISGVQDFPEGTPRLTMGTVVDFLPQYALVGRSLDLVAIAPGDWASIREPKETYRFLQQRRQITATKNPRLPFLPWVVASAPPDASRNVWGTADVPEWGRPQVQPEQIRLQTFAALSAGNRAVGFRADSGIAGPSGESRLIEMAFLNAEIDLVQSHLARGTDPIVFVPCFSKDIEVPIIYNPMGATSGAGQQKFNPFSKLMVETPPHPSVRAASIPTAEGRGRLILVCDYAANGQYQPPQSAQNDLKVLVQAPENAQGLEITLGGVKVLTKERTTGGTRFTVPVFSVTTMILVTTDLSMKAQLEAEVARIAPKATEMAIRQARAELAETATINARLADYGHLARDSDDLIRQCGEILKLADEAREREEYDLAWDEARRAGRALRVLRRAHYQKAYVQLQQLTNALAKAEDSKFPYPLTYPIASPPLTAWQTLPQHWLWMDMIRERSAYFGENLLPSGLFDVDGVKNLADEGWSDVSHQGETADTRYEIVTKAGFGGDNPSLRLVVAPKDLGAKAIDKLVPFLDHPAVAVKSPPIEVYKNCLVRIRCLVRLTRYMPTATGGLIIQDSIGGEPYQYRVPEACPVWREVVLYRKAPEDGTMTVTLGLAGYGEAYFDRLRIDTLTAPGADEPTPRAAPNGPLARRPSPPAVNPAADGDTRPRR